MSTATQPPLTRQKFSELQLIIITISAILLFSSLFAIKGISISSFITASITILAVGVSGTLHKYGLTKRASSRIALAGSFLGLFAGAALFSGASLMLITVLLTSFIVLASIQLALYL